MNKDQSRKIELCYQFARQFFNEKKQKRHKKLMKKNKLKLLRVGILDLLIVFIPGVITFVFPLVHAPNLNLTTIDKICFTIICLVGIITIMLSIGIFGYYHDDKYLVEKHRLEDEAPEDEE